MIRPNEVVIHDGNAQDFVGNVVVGGEVKAKGLIPRDYNQYPVGYYRSAVPFHSVDMPTIPQSEWSARIREKITSKSQMSDIRMYGNNGNMIPSLDQNGRGYCWAHSSTSAVTLLRAVQGQPYVGLSAYAIACIIKNYRDEGGWGAQSLDFIMERGVPSEAFWPMKSVNSANDNPRTWENAALHKVTEGWVDLQAAQYDRNLSRDQFATCWLLNIPTVNDYNWWGHSVCGMDLVDGQSQWGFQRDGVSGKLLSLNEFDKVWKMNDPMGGYGCRILNSWGDDWSDNGMGVLTADKAWPDGGVAARVTIPSIT